MSIQAGQESVSVGQPRPFLDIDSARIKPCTLHEDTRDSTNTPTTQLRRGLVVGYDSGNDAYYDAGDAAVDAHEQAVIDSAEAPDSDWQGETITIDVEGVGQIVHTVGGSVTNIATAITDINGSGAGAFVTASNDGSGNLRLTANSPGRRMTVASSLSTAYGGSTLTDDADLTTYGILYETIPSVLDMSGSATKRNASIVIANAVVRESDLLELTQAARTYFERANIQLV